jgi:hypothetical protein
MKFSPQRMVPFFSFEIFLVFIGFLRFSLSESGVLFQYIATKKGKPCDQLINISLGKLTLFFSSSNPIQSQAS